MGFFGKVKQFFGAGTVKVEIVTSETFVIDERLIKGSLTITGKSDQLITDIEIKLEESFTIGKGEDKKTKNFTWGEMKLPGFEIKADEVKNIPFELPFDYSKSKNEEMTDKGGIVGGLGKVSSFMDGEKSTYKLVATADVKGAAFDPNDVKILKKAKA
jgi:hypothetical protein